MKSDNKLISIVIPAYNEEIVLNDFYSRLKGVVDQLNMDVEIIYINDGSKDKTLELMSSHRSKDERISIINFSRNFGKEIALTAGLDHAVGDAVIVIDADLQDPPELIKELIKYWQDGYEVVNAKRISRRNESIPKKMMSYLYYRFLAHLSDIQIPKDTGDFRLMDRKAIDALMKLRERHRYMKGLFAWVGFSQIEVEYERDGRYAGETKWSFWNLLNLAFDGLTSFSVLPLRLASIIGILSAFTAFIFGLMIIVKKIFFGDPVTGYPSLVVLITFIGGVQLMALGILGEYLGRVFNETKNRPLYIIKDMHPSLHMKNRSTNSK